MPIQPKKTLQPRIPTVSTQGPGAARPAAPAGSVAEVQTDNPVRPDGFENQPQQPSLASNRPVVERATAGRLPLALAMAHVALPTNANSGWCAIPGLVSKWR
jgi:hypothetical protein